jgi:hypothetical protein
MAKKEDKPVLVDKANLPANPMPAYDEDAGSGFENFAANDVSIPFLIVLQANSPQVKRGDQQIKDAKEGDILNTITGQLFTVDTGIFVIPCGYNKAYVEWRPRESGGGFVQQHKDESILTHTKKNETGRDVLANGNLVVTTAYHYVLLLDPVTKDYSQAVIAFTSTQLKKSRKWNSYMLSLKMTRGDGSKFTPPMFSHVYHITTVAESNELGAWSGWHIEMHEPVVDNQLYAAAREFSTLIRSGKVAVAAPPQTEDTVTDTSDVPF